MTPIEKIEALAAEGLSISAVMVTDNQDGTLRVEISINSYLPLGEGVSQAGGYHVSIDRDNIPAGITCMGRERWPDEMMTINGNAEQAEALIREIADVGDAPDWAAFDGCRWLTKPTKWHTIGG